jgi:hypothetical protein
MRPRRTSGRVVTKRQYKILDLHFIGAFGKICVLVEHWMLSRCTSVICDISKLWTPWVGFYASTIASPKARVEGLSKSARG